MAFPIHILKFPHTSCQLFSLQSGRYDYDALFDVYIIRKGGVMLEPFSVGGLALCIEDGVWYFEGREEAPEIIANGVATHLYNTVKTSASVGKHPTLQQIAADVLAMMMYIDEHDLMLAPPPAIESEA